MTHSPAVNDPPVIKAMLMAAGVGTRLRPLTEVLPKPLFPIVNRPVVEHTLELLRRHGIREVAINLHHEGERLRGAIGDGARWGLAVRYSVEKTLLGTAGGVKRLERFFRAGSGPFLVMSGDGLTDVDLTAALRFHRERRAMATMVLKPVDVRFEYGVTVVDRRGRIRRFLEKPSWSEVFSNTVNTGIYVFEPRVFRYIPPGRVYDFGHQVWPALLRRGEPVYGYVDRRAYWCDIGNLNEYRRGHRDALDRKIRLTIPGTQVRPGVWVGEGTRIERGVKFHAPCVIGRNCRIGEHAVVEGYTAIGDGARIGARARLADSILWQDVKVARGVRLRHCIIGTGARVSESVSVYEGSVIQLNSDGERSGRA